MVRGPPKLYVDDECNFVDPQVLENVLTTKFDTFAELDVCELRKARSRANAFETIRNGIFMNRAAMKMANIDAITDFMFTSLDYDSVHKRDGPYYFADVCAGPGGFTEYILWRKNWCYKGFGFTLRGEHDFKLQESTCVSSDSFHPFYGPNGDGNIYNLENIQHFKRIILEHTQGVGVHFVMSDGGFSVEGNENLQEVLSKQIYTCQCLMALEILRPHGYFVTKMFDLFTSFSVGLIYLMHLCFNAIAIVKPNTSRPANSERYFICKDFKNTHQSSEIRRYLEFVVQDMWHAQPEDSDNDILELIPLDILLRDTRFSKYMHDSNTSIAERQIIGLQKLKFFCHNPELVEVHQETCRLKCLNLWRIPDRKRAAIQNVTASDIASSISQPAFMLTQPKEISVTTFDSVIDEMNDWRFVPLCSSKPSNFCHIFVGMSNSKVSKLVGNKWVKVKNMHLNRGTVLYGEIVKEKCISMRDGIETEKLSLHVIDALRLGDVSLADLSFEERAKSISIFCEAINFEVDGDVRIRPKEARCLQDLYTKNIIEYKQETREYNAVGAKNSNEYYSVNAILFLKVNSHQSFNSTYVLRSVVNINEHDTTHVSCKLIDVIKKVRSLNKK
ncbi:hypothetical protein AMK59_5051 [Oryctes borbonicus]|uniref:Cap-specific mRNA (nucleoside-2'-O-)-methyltransferase 1 n=1 Tax=Oryctes borbonicus TaxID=1629725 RepID=A0A0T6B3J1_9SCAR|nr:hypothetical protein AMK59_5051 [Oryctes borbonicus]